MLLMRSVWDFDGYIVSINPAHHIVLGWSIEELSSAPSWEFVHPDNQDWMKRCQRLLLTRSEALFGLELRMLRRDGTYQWTRWNARSVPQQRLLCLDGIEITDHEQTEATPPMLVGSWDWHIRTDTATWSDEMFQIFGLTRPTRVTKDTVLARVHPADRDPLLRAIHRSVACAEPFSTDHRVQHPQRGYRVLHSVGRVITDADGNPQRIRGITQDLTDHTATA